MRGLLVLAVLFCGGLPLKAQTPDDMFQQAMLEMFEGDWQQALEKLNRVLASTASEQLKSRSFFFSARALEKLGREEEALSEYDRFLERGSGETALRKEAGFARVKIASQLYLSGKTRYADRVLQALTSEDAELRFLAAVQLSYFPEASLKRRAVDVLQESLSREGDAELRNQAALALLRIDPRLLGEESKTPEKGRTASLHLTLQTSDGEKIRLALPLSLARIAMGALPEDVRKDLQADGINPDNILDALSRTDEILEVKSEECVIRLWIE